MSEQAPKIEPGRGRLRYEKERKTIVADEPDNIRMLREALAPFAAIGGLVAMGDLPDETVASYMRLDGLTALEFREAYKAFLATNPKA